MTVGTPRFGGSVHQLRQEDLADGEVGAGVSGRAQILDGPYGADAQHEIPQSFARTDERVQRAVGGQGVLLAGNSGVPQHLRGAFEVLGIWCPKKGYNRSRRQHRRTPRRCIGASGNIILDRYRQRGPSHRARQIWPIEY